MFIGSFGIDAREPMLSWIVHRVSSSSLLSVLSVDSPPDLTTETYFAHVGTYNIKSTWPPFLNGNHFSLFPTPTYPVYMVNDRALIFNTEVYLYWAYPHKDFNLIHSFVDTFTLSPVGHLNSYLHVKASHEFIWVCFKTYVTLTLYFISTLIYVIFICQNVEWAQVHEDLVSITYCIKSFYNLSM